MSDREGHGHKAIVYKSHFPPLRHSVVTETPARYLANKPHLTKDQALCSLCPHDSANCKYGGAHLLFWSNFSKKLDKNEAIWNRRRPSPFNTPMFC